MTKYESIVTALSSDPKFQKLPAETKRKILNDLAKKHNISVPKNPSEVINSISKRAVDSEGNIREVEGLEAIGSDEQVDSALKDAAKNYGMKAAANVAMGALAGAPVGPESLVSPSGIASAIGGVVTEALGFGTEDLGVIGNLGMKGLGMALSAVNPALGIAAGVLGKPVAELAMDYMDVRNLEAPKDELENLLGEIEARSISKEALNELDQTKEQYKDYGSYRDMANAKAKEVNMEMERQKTTPNVDAMEKLQKELNTLEELATIEDYAVAGYTAKEIKEKVQQKPGTGLQGATLKGGTREVGSGLFSDKEAQATLEEAGRRAAGGFGFGEGGGEHSGFGGGGMSAGGEYGGSSSTQGGHDVGESMQA